MDTNLRGHPDVLWYPRWDSWANVKADWSTWPNSYGDAPNSWPKLFFTTAPEFGNIPAGRFESQSLTPNTTKSGTGSGALNGVDIFQMNKYFNQNTRGMWTGSAVGNVPLNDVYMRYCFMAEASVWAGINENGMKLPGLQVGGGELPGEWMWHSIPGAPNSTPYKPPYALSDPIRLTTYFHGGDLQAGSVYGKSWIQPPTHDIKPDTWYCVEQRLKVNSRQADGTGNSDGLMDVWINDALVLSFRNIKIKDWRNWHPVTKPVEVWAFNGLIYHGGQNHTPAVPIHYRVTGVVLAKKRIGMPRRSY